MRSLTLMERISKNLANIKKYEGEKVLGKRKIPLKKFFIIKEEIEKMLNVYVYEHNNKVVVTDETCKYRVSPTVVLFIIDNNGRLKLEKQTVKIAEHIEDWLLKCEKEYEKLLKKAREFITQFNRTPYDYLVRKEETKEILEELQKVIFKIL